MSLQSFTPKKLTQASNVGALKLCHAYNVICCLCSVFHCTQLSKLQYISAHSFLNNRGMLS